MPQRNTPERRDMLAARAACQRKRTAGFMHMPKGSRPERLRAMVEMNGASATLGELFDRPAFRPRPDFLIIPAWMNRRTGEPHEHNREKARHG